MKLHSLFFNIFLLSAVIFLLIFPPLYSEFFSASTYVTFSQWAFPYKQMVLFVAAMIILLLNQNLIEKKEINIQKKSVYFVFYFITPFLFTFLLLFVNSLFFSFLSALKIFNNTAEVTVAVPDNLISWIYCLLNFIFAAFYEEVIYRFYFIDELSFLLNKSNNKIVKYVLEAFGILIFALSHYYLGIVSVFNAAIAHIILRICYKKSGNILPGVMAHFCYNIISLILL